MNCGQWNEMPYSDTVYQPFVRIANYFAVCRTDYTLQYYTEQRYPFTDMRLFTRFRKKPCGIVKPTGCCYVQNIMWEEIMAENKKSNVEWLKTDSVPRFRYEGKEYYLLNDMIEVEIGGVHYRVKSLYSDKAFMGDVLDTLTMEKIQREAA